MEYSVHYQHYHSIYTYLKRLDD